MKHSPPLPLPILFGLRHQQARLNLSYSEISRRTGGRLSTRRIKNFMRGGRDIGAIDLLHLLDALRLQIAVSIPPIRIGARLRRRRLTALALHRQGMPQRQIAAYLGTTYQRVGYWLELVGHRKSRSAKARSRPFLTPAGGTKWADDGTVCGRKQIKKMGRTLGRRLGRLSDEVPPIIAPDAFFEALGLTSYAKPNIDADDAEHRQSGNEPGTDPGGPEGPNRQSAGTANAR